MSDHAFGYSQSHWWQTVIILSNRNHGKSRPTPLAFGELYLPH